MRREVLYTFAFAGMVCVVCGLLVSSAAVALKPLQDANSELERQRNILQAAGLMEPGEKLERDEIAARFEKIDPVMVDLESGTEKPDMDPGAFEEAKVLGDPSLSREAPPNPAGVKRLANAMPVYRVRDAAGGVEMLVIPIEGKGLWSTLYGFLALDRDTNTIRGITFYQHGETPGLGGEVDNPRWKDLWKGRKAYDEQWDPAIRVIKGRAASPDEDPHKVDGLSGATLTSNGVSHLVDFWLGEEGFGPYLKNFREGGTA